MRRVRSHTRLEEISMDKRFIITVVCSTLGLISANGFAQAETVGRYECSVVGAASQEPIGDRDGHRLISVQFIGPRGD